MSHDEEKKLYYLEKMKQYGEFAEDMQSLLFYDLIKVESFL